MVYRKLALTVLVQPTCRVRQLLMGPLDRRGEVRRWGCGVSGEPVLRCECGVPAEHVFFCPTVIGWSLCSLASSFVRRRPS